MARARPTNDLKALAIKVAGVLVVAAILAVVSGLLAAKINGTVLNEHSRRLCLVEENTTKVVRLQAIQEELVRKVDRMDAKIDRLEGKMDGKLDKILDKLDHE